MSELVVIGEKSGLFTPKVRAEIDKWIAKYPPGRQQSAVIPSLHILQRENKGSLSKALMQALAVYLDMPEVSVFEVATFYSLYDLSPVGQHKMNLCTNVSCLLQGAEAISEHIQQRLQIGFGETTVDGMITLKEVECLGACCGAPMLQLDETYHEDLTIEKVDALLDELMR